MNHKLTLGLGFIVGISAAACGSDTTNPGGTPAAPSLGEQIDRMGRPGVNTALSVPFDTDMARQDAKKDEYNATPQSQWVSKYKPVFAPVLAIYDSADTQCGNQFAAGMTATAGRYDALAGVLADDQLYVNTDSGTCMTYLGVEANATMIIPNSDCGGRAPPYDVIKLTYGVLTTGMYNTMITDGVAPKSNFSASAFPFLAKP